MEKVEEIVINLTNKLFSYFLIIINNVSSNHINSVNTACDTIITNLFTYIAID